MRRIEPVEMLVSSCDEMQTDTDESRPIHPSADGPPCCRCGCSCGRCQCYATHPSPEGPNPRPDYPWSKPWYSTMTNSIGSNT